MLPNPLTPPPDTVDEGQNNHPGLSTPQNNSLFATPISNDGIGLDTLEPRSESAEDRSDGEEAEDQVMSDEDMEDGGAALTSTASNVQELGYTMNNANAGALGEENFLGLLHTAQNASMQMGNQFFYSDSFPPALDEDILSVIHDVDMDNHFQQENPLPNPGVPATIMEVAQQLQQLQDVQEHADFEDAPLEQHTVINNSMTPFHFPPHLINGDFPFYEAGQYVSMADISTANSFPVATPSQNTPHFSGTPSPNNPHVTPWSQFLQHESFLQQTQISWGDGDADLNEVDENNNFGLGDFLHDWGIRATAAQASDMKKRSKGPSIPELHAQRFPDSLPPMKRKDLLGEQCDIQRIDWQKLGVTRLEARQRRLQTYRNYTNLRIPSKWHPRLYGSPIRDDDNFFKFRRMDFDHEVHLEHFQLRNLLSCASRDHVFYASKSKIIQWNPTSGTQGPKRVAMNLTNPSVQRLYGQVGGIQISTLSVGHDILVTGGFSGEYALVNLKARKGTKHTEGIVTNHQNSITNHVQVHLSRTSLSPRVAIASNDNGMRILDVATNKFVADHGYDHAINCTAVSPDQRLRVLVGDSRQVMICNAETGEILQSLEGHRDFGFACDWSDDGYTVATGNQDMQIKIWDARNWTTRQGLPCPVTTIAAEMAGVRKLKFSPLGSGKRVLVAAEPADIMSIIDAETFQSKQRLNFFGEIGGFDFTNGGRDLIVANCDSMRGGLMEFERCPSTSNSFYDMDDLLENRNHKRLRGGAWRSSIEEPTRHSSSWGSESRRGNPSLLGSQMGNF